MSYFLTLTLVLGACFTLQTLALRAVGGRTNKSESNFFSSLARIQTGIRNQPRIMLLGSSITGRLPDRTKGFEGVANLGCDGANAVDTLRAMDDGRLPTAPFLIIEGNTLYRSLGGHRSEIAQAIGSPWFRLGEKIPNLSATARPSAFFYSLLLARKIGNGSRDRSPRIEANNLPRIPVGSLPELSDGDQRLIRELAELIGRLQQRGSKVLLTILPPGGPGDSAHITLPTALAIKSRIPLWDLASGLPPERIRFTDGVHMDPDSAAAVTNLLLNSPPPMTTNPPKSKMEAPRLLQLFNQYLEPGGEEVWVNQMLHLGDNAFSIKDLRFHSGAWMGRGAPFRLKQATLLWNHPQARAKLREEVGRNRPDALLFHNIVPVASLGMYDEARALDLPVVQYIHNFRPFSPSGTMWLRNKVNPAALHGNPWPEVFGRAWEKSFLRTLLLAIYQRRLLVNGPMEVVKQWIAVSNFMRDKFIEAGIPADRVTSLRHCWQARPILERAIEGKHYLFLGRLVPEKGISTLLEAWTILEKRLGQACPQLIIAGSGSEEARIHAKAGTMRRVTCIGFVAGDLKDELIRSCRGLIAPSIWWEPLGLIVHEAYDVARPVLAAKSGGLTETVTEGVTGYLHTPGDAEQLARDVERLEMLGTAGRAEMGEHGRQWLLSKASPEEWRDEFVSIIRRAIG